MKLKHKIVIHFVVDGSDLEELIRETYGHSYELTADMECRNDSEYEYMLKKKELNEYQKKDLAKFIQTGEYYFIWNTLLQDMVNRSILDEGNYLIRVSW
jgi:hypothetical protein